MTTPSPKPQESSHFDPEIEEALQSLIKQFSLPRPGAQPGPLAVFDADGTLWADDLGESFFQWLIAEKKLLRPGPTPYEDPWAAYQTLCSRDPGAAYASLGPQLVGLSEAQIREDSRDHFTATFSSRIYEAQRSLVQRFLKAGWEVWICSATCRVVVEAGAEAFGIPNHQVMGVEVEIAEGLFTDKLIPPVTYRHGKVEAITQNIGRAPQFVSGNSMTDLEMLKMAQELGLVINPSDELTDHARDQRWLIQRF